MTQQGEYQPKKHSSTPTLMTLTDLLYQPASKVCLESELKEKLSKWLSLSLHSSVLYARLVLVVLMGCLPFTVYCGMGEIYILVLPFHLQETKHSLCSFLSSWEYFLNDVCHTCVKLSFFPWNYTVWYFTYWYILLNKYKKSKDLLRFILKLVINNCLYASFW